MRSNNADCRNGDQQVYELFFSRLIQQEAAEPGNKEENRQSPAVMALIAMIKGQNAKEQCSQQHHPFNPVAFQLSFYV